MQCWGSYIFYFFPKLIVLFCLSDVGLALFGCYRKEQTRICREGMQFLKWDIRGAALQEPSILVKMIPRILHNTVKVSTPQCIYKSAYCRDIFILSKSWTLLFFASYCTHLTWCLIVALGAATGPSVSLPPGKKRWRDVTQKDTHIHHRHGEEEVTTINKMNYLQSIKSTSLSD